MGSTDILCEKEDTKRIVQEEDQDDIHKHLRRPDDWSRRLNSMPLVAALLAPLSTLLDIPAMTVSERLAVSLADHLSDIHLCAFSNDGIRKMA